MIARLLAALERIATALEVLAAQADHQRVEEAVARAAARRLDEAAFERRVLAVVEARREAEGERRPA